MIQQGYILNSDKELDVPDLTNESNSIGNDTKCSAETRESCEGLKPAISTDRRIDPPCHGVRSVSCPFITQSSYNFGSEVQLKEVGSIAKKISEIIMDRPVNYRWMFSDTTSSKAPPSSEEGKLFYYRFIKHFKSNCSDDLVKYFCDKLYYLIRDEKNMKKIKYFLALFWKRVESEIENKLYLYSGDDALLEGILGLLEEDDIHSCIEKLLTITTSTNDFKFLFRGLSYLELKNEEFPLTDPEDFVRKLLQLLTISSPEITVQQFYDKLIDATRQEEKFEYVKKRLIFFWKRILRVIETKFEPGEAELSERLLTEMTKHLDETFDREKLSDIVIRIIKNVDTLEYSFEWAQIFQKKFSLAETTDDAGGRSVFCKFIHRLQMSQGEETVGQFCDDLHREIIKELVPEVTKKRLLVFWNRILYLIKQKIHPGETEYSENLLSEIKKTLIDTFQKGPLLISVIKRVVETFETSKQLDRFSEIFSPYGENICHLADEEKKVRLAYDKFILLLKQDNGRKRVNKFMYLLYEPMKENVISGDVWKLCVIFWNRVLSFVDQVSVEENNDDESELMDTLLEILNDTFYGEDISNLCGKLSKSMEGCRNQHTLQWLFQSDIVNHKPLSIEDNRLDYYKFIQRLISTHSKENVQSFCDQLYDNISKEKITVILPTLLMIFWIRVHCLIEDQFSAIRFDFEQNLLPEMIRIVNDTFRGDNWLTKYSVSQVGCNGFRIQCAAWVYEWYYKRFYRNSVWLREHHLNIAKFDKCCYLTCIIVDIAIDIIKVCTALFIFIHYFKTHFWND